jgi:peptide/nickel transport system ATP-binding protein
MSAEPLLALDGLSVEFSAPQGRKARVLDRVSFDLQAGETLGLVGESGSGKSATALAVMGLLDGAAVVTAGRIVFDGEDLLKAGEARLCALRGRRLAMVFQHPRRALNPIRKVGLQLADVLRAHEPMSGREALGCAVTMLADVGIADPKARAGAYPFELSGGMCQRVMIALALAASPRLLIADEPTTGLDVTTQAMILDLIGALARQRNMAMLFITHDLALAAERCDRIAVLHAGHLVEAAPADMLMRRPAHPYTRHLVGSTPRPASRLQDLTGVPGTSPDLSRADLPPCRFLERCDRRIARCSNEALPLKVIGERHKVACWRPG